MRFTRLVLLSYSLMLCIFLFACKNEKTASPSVEKTEKQEKQEKLGIIDIQVTGLEKAKPHFTRGLLLMHNFEYEDAREAFLEAQAIDSTFVMSYWGEAMTYNHPLWRQQDYEKGQTALTKLANSQTERKALAATDLEKDFLEAVEILYGEGKKKERDRRYSDFLADLYKKYPENQEIASFYALSCLGAVAVGRDNAAYEKGASIAQKVIKVNPNHPGALHYLIHSYDDPGHASLALEAANSYSKVAADAAHALHMPSHIYVAVGMWDEVVDCNIASWDASIKRMEEKALGGDARSYHAIHWRMYGHLQKGQFEQAARLLEEVNGYIDDESSKRSRSYHPWMKANYLVETGQWDSELANTEIKTDDLNIRSQAALDYIAGMQAHKKGEPQKISALLKEMANRRTLAETLVSSEGTPMCNAAGANRYAPNRTDIDQAHIMEMELQALRHWETPKIAEEWLHKAAALEEATSYAYGPPIVVQPSHELYGQWLLENNRAKEAKPLFEKAIQRGPNRLHAMQGMLAVHESLKEKDAAAALQQKINKLLSEADVAVKEQLGLGQLISER